MTLKNSIQNLQPENGTLLMTKIMAYEIDEYMLAGPLCF